MKDKIAILLVKLAEILGYRAVPLAHNCQELSAKAVVDSILERPIKWVDWSKMPTDKRREWGNQAKAALQNNCIQSLIGVSGALDLEATNGEITKRILESIGRYSKNHNETENMRHIICGVELIKELLEEMLVIEDRDIPPEDPNAAI